MLVLCLSCSLVPRLEPVLHADASEIVTTLNGYYEATTLLNLRAGPGKDYDLTYTDDTKSAVVTVPLGTHLLVTETQDSYGKTCFQGWDGWVALEYCEYIRGFVSPSDGESAMIDISSFQSPSDFNWNKIKASGVTGVIIRLGGRYARVDGEIYEDPKWKEHYAAAKAAGMNVGFYFFSYAMTREAAVEEAQFCLNLIKQNNLVAELPIFMDVEDLDADTAKPHYNGGKTLNNMLINSFCSTIENAGFYAGVYTNYNFITNVIDPVVLTNRSFWYAQYNSYVSYTGRYDIWQYTSSGTVDGYNEQSALDMNQCYRDFPSFIKQYSFNGFKNELITDGNGHTHVYSMPTVVQAATCTADGLQNINCATCGELMITETINKTEHSQKSCFLPGTFVDFSLNQTLSSLPANPYDLSTEDGVLGTYTAINETGGSLINYCSTCRRILSVCHFDAAAGCSHQYNMTQATYRSRSTMNLRSGPAESYSALKNDYDTVIYIPSGVVINVTYQLGNWGNVEYNETYGWISLHLRLRQRRSIPLRNHNKPCRMPHKWTASCLLHRLRQTNLQIYNPGTRSCCWRSTNRRRHLHFCRRCRKEVQGLRWSVV